MLSVTVMLLKTQTAPERVTSYEKLMAHLSKLTNVDLEANIPTFFSVLLLLFAWLLLLIIATYKRQQRDKFALHWQVLNFGFMIMALDELAQIHECSIVAMQRLLREGMFGGIYFAWVIPAIALVLLLGLFFVRFIMHLSRTDKIGFISAAAVYLTGAVGMEIIGGQYLKHCESYVIYNLITTVEESMEMFGMVLFIRALLKYMTEHIEPVTVLVCSGQFGKQGERFGAA